MKKIVVIITSIALLLTPAVLYAQSEQTATQAPPVAQPLVREGDFAVKLVDALKMGTAQNEAEAETTLASSGIAPRNGWIADYPVTPDIAIELQKAVVAAADSNKLPMGRDEAWKAYLKVSADLGLPVMVADTSGDYAEGPPSQDYGPYTAPVVNDYYYDVGPPVVTYYPPPWDYSYLYAWVPSPFWWSGFYFRGFFILNDFHRVTFHHHKPFVVSNHFKDRHTGRVSVIDPASRRGGKRFTSGTHGPRPGNLHSPEFRRGATSIVERSQERGRFGGRTGITGERGGPTTRFEGRPGLRSGAVAAGPGTIDPSTGRNRAQPGMTWKRQEADVQTPPSAEGRSFNPQTSRTPSDNRQFSRPSEGAGRSFSSPSVRSERSISPSTRSDGRSFSSPPAVGRSFSSPAPSAPPAPRMDGRSFSPPSSGSRGTFQAAPGGGRGSSGGGGFSGGGFRAGDGSGRGGGGCRGRC